MLLVAAGATGIAMAREKPGPVRDLHYGEVLFHFYQQDEFTALTRLLAAQDAGHIVNQQEEAELLLGGLYLSYGQTEEASRIFDRLLADATDPSVHDRIWHFIGKSEYQRGRHAAADAAFDKVGKELTAELQAEHRLLRAQNLMAQSRFDDAIVLLENERTDQVWQSYARFNLGVALIRLGRLGEGIEQLDRVGRLKTVDPELIALRDKANLAMGFAYLQDQQGQQAREMLGRVSVNGLNANKALLGFGWADVLQEKYQRALTPWLELSERDLLDSSVQESLLAIPYAFSRIGANGSAADYYVSAMHSFDQELTRLDRAIARARSGQMIPALLALDERGLGHWNWQLDALPDTEDARYLFHFIANHRFQDGLRNFRDLVALREHLAAWVSKLDAFESMIETRAAGYAERLPSIENRLAQIDSSALRIRRQELADALEAIESARDIKGLATAEEADWLQRLKALEANPAWKTKAASDARNKHRILNGTLLWELDREYRYRLWQQQTDVEKIERDLADAGALEARTQFIRADMPLKLEEFRLRIGSLQPRIEAMLQQIDAVLGIQQKQLQAIVIDELRSRQQRLASYRIQARFALATLYDQATVRSADTAESAEEQP